MATGELVNLSLDEIIARQNKFKQFGNGQRGRNRGARGVGLFRNGFRGRQIPTIGSVQRQKYVGQGGQRPSNEKLCTVHISNLGPMVTTRDLQELFAQHPYVDIAVHYDQRGNSRGTAVVLFRRFDEAMQLKREFTGVKLDGRIMELYAMSNAITTPATRVLQQISNYSIQKGRVAKLGNRRKLGGFPSNKSFDNFGGFRIMKGNRGKIPSSKRPQMTAEQLDRELDAYMRSAKHTRIEAP